MSAANQISKDQLQRIVRTIVMHDVPVQMKKTDRRPVEACQLVLRSLEMNFGTKMFDRKVAEKLVYEEIMEC